MVNYLDLNGATYEEDKPNLLRMLKDLTETIKVTNWEGPELNHTFTTILPEVIKHGMGVTPTKVVVLKSSGAQGTYRFVEADSQTITLEASIVGLELDFYVER